MPVRVKQSGDESLYYLTFTCFNWLPLFQVANAYDAVYKWFEYLKNKKNIKVTAYVVHWLKTCAKAKTLRETNDVDIKKNPTSAVYFFSFIRTFKF